jgi:competence ComEA-like helix-hairpin-helix protein
VDFRREAQRSRTGKNGAPPSGFAQRRACLLLSLIVLVWNVGATGRHFLSGGSPRLVSAAATDGAVTDPSGPLTAKQNYLLGIKVDINRASLAEIEGLPGISPKVAESVLETRKRLGGFRRPVDLLQVKGIKEKRLKKILPFLLEFPNN